MVWLGKHTNRRTKPQARKQRDRLGRGNRRSLSHGTQTPSPPTPHPCQGLALPDRPRSLPTQDETLSQNEVYARYTRPVFGPDVVYAADPKKRNQQMQHMAYGLRTTRLKAYVSMIEKETRSFLKSWGESVRSARRGGWGGSSRASAWTESRWTELVELEHEEGHGPPSNPSPWAGLREGVGNTGEGWRGDSETWVLVGMCLL